MVDRPGFEPGASATLERHSMLEECLPRRRSTADLPAQRIELDEAGAGNVFARPAIFADSAGPSKSTGCTSLFPNMVGSTATAAAANMRLFILFPKSGCTLYHCSSLTLFLGFFSSRLDGRRQEDNIVTANNDSSQFLRRLFREILSII